ncbi:MAG: H/ACA ribonucleoprotein complex subunit GAR1 [Halobacteriales archaeon]
MQRVGTVVRTAQGLAIARSPDGSYPDLGATVVDEQLDGVGRVVDVMGPTERPYVVIRPAEDRPPAGLLNTKLYAR